MTSGNATQSTLLLHLSPQVSVEKTYLYHGLLAKKGAGKEAKLSYSGHVLMENRNGLVAEVEVLQANGTAERDAALVMIEKIPGDQPVTVGADKAYDTKDFVQETRNMNATPHVAQNNSLVRGNLWQDK